MQTSRKTNDDIFANKKSFWDDLPKILVMKQRLPLQESVGIRVDIYAHLNV